MAETANETGERDRPDLDRESPVLLFDGVCNLCNGTVQFVIRRDPDGTVSFAPLQSEVGRELTAACDRDPDALESVVLIEEGDCYTRSEAALRVARHLDSPYRHLWALRIVPRPIRDAVYDLVARYRYRIFGRREECMVPSPDVRDRFLSMSDGE